MKQISLFYMYHLTRNLLSKRLKESSSPEPLKLILLGEVWFSNQLFYELVQCALREAGQAVLSSTELIFA